MCASRGAPLSSEQKREYRAFRKILDALFFRPSEQLVLRLKSPAAGRRVAVEGQVEFQAVWENLDAALKSPVAVAEGPEHGGGVSAQG